MPLFLLLLAIPMIEIALFVSVGGEIGIWWTLAIVVVTAVLGTLALRNQGFTLLRRAQTAEGLLETPTLLSEGLLVFAAGLLLLTPGFLTDAIGFALLAPPVRQWVAREILKRAKVVVAQRRPGAGHPPGGEGSSPRGGPQSPRPHPPRHETPPDPDPGDPDAGPSSLRKPRPGTGDVEDAVILDPDRRTDR